MISHERIWAAIDQLADTYDLTPSGLAKRAGLDSTTFNKSKRFARDGRARWPSTESLAKVMSATGANLSDFLAFTEGHDEIGTVTKYHTGNLDLGLSDSGFAEPESNSYKAQLRDIPVVGMAQAGAGGFFDDAGFPAGQGWDLVQFPGLDLKQDIYALEITGDSMLPLYRERDIIIVSPSASVRRGDRVVAKTVSGEIMAKILKRKNETVIELASANGDHPDRIFAANEIEWLARILWVSQ